MAVSLSLLYGDFDLAVSSSDDPRSEIVPPGLAAFSGPVPAQSRREGPCLLALAAKGRAGPRPSSLNGGRHLLRFSG